MMPPSRRRNVRLAALLVVAWLALVICRAGARLISVGSGARGPVGLLVLTATVNAYWLAAGPALLWCRSKLASSGALARHVIVALSCIVVTLAEPLWYRVVLAAFHGVPLDWSSAVFQRADVNVLLVVLIVAAASVRDSHGRAAIRQRQRDELEAVLADAELRALTLQLQPHFLFNTLQLAAEAAFDDIDAARRIVRDLQTLLQRSFRLEEHTLVRVADEVDFLEAYAAIQRQRFGTRLSIHVQVEPTASTLLVPPLLLQPLVENSIQHGLGPLARDGRVVVSLQLVGDRLHIDVRDNGIGFMDGLRTAGASGLGLGVTRRRLSALFPGRHSIETGVADGGGAAVTIIIPALSANAGALVVPDPSPSVPRGPPRLDTARWPLSALAALVATALLVAANVFVGEILFRSPPGVPQEGLVPPDTAAWIPTQVLTLVLIVILWRARAVHVWLRLRDRDARNLHAQIESARSRSAPLRLGKDIMLSTLDQLLLAHNAVEFDEMIISSSERIRSLLARAESGGSALAMEPEVRG